MNSSMNTLSNGDVANELRVYLYNANRVEVNDINQTMNKANVKLVVMVA